MQRDLHGMLFSPLTRSAGVATVLALAIGCTSAASADGDDADEGALEAATPDMALSRLPVRAVKITTLRAAGPHRRVTVGAFSKVGALQRSVTAAPQSDAPCEEGSPTAVMEFVDQSAKVLATVRATCSVGSLVDASGRRRVSIDSNVLSRVLDAPLVPGDGLWAVSRVIVASGGGSEREESDAAEISKLTAMVNSEQPLSSTPGPTCAAHTLTFLRGRWPARTAATLSVGCGDESTGPKRPVVDGKLTVFGEDERPLVEGAVRVDTTPFWKMK